ncbi:hypothetical protein LPJ63_000616 [Coemansia sp. RSA 2711]|nr:hypothetical protein LPJ63_000616 [Coemansia sp. RSA 2711]
MPNTLRSLSISRHKGTQKHIELVRHNADTLESLCVDHITTHSMLKMTWGKNGGYHTQVYPRLKLLHIQFCVGQRNKTYRQPLADPFPRLQTLICPKNDTMLKIHLATNLRVLDMPRHKVPFTELIPLLSGLPALQKARVVLGDVPTQNMLRMPTFEQINEYRELFKSHSTSAWALGISDLVFGNSRRAAEFLVLLVDILSSIKRVSISYNCTRTSYKVVNAVEFVKRRKIYKSNPAIEDVEFVSSASW